MCRHRALAPVRASCRRRSRDARMTRLPDEIRPVLDSGIPAVMVTCSSDGIPTVTVISEVYYFAETLV